MRVLITGSGGFVGRNLVATLSRRGGYELRGFDVEDQPESLTELVGWAEAIVHLAGVNRPQQVEEFQTGNAGFTAQLVELAEATGRAIPLVLSSSTQAALDNPYGKSKGQVEELVYAYGQRTGAPVHVFRLPNVFGKWCRPHYNSAVATFCHCIARDMPISINDPAASLTLVYIDDVVAAIEAALMGQVQLDGGFCQVPVVHRTTVGEVADLLKGFRASRGDLSLPELVDGFQKKLFATYLSYLPEGGFSYPLMMHCDARGSFTEFLRTPERGQVSVNISRPGITKGNHWHHTKHEKFLVVSGCAAIRFRKIGSDDVLTYEVSGERLEVVDIPPGYTHNITNIGEGDLVTVMWVNEAYDPNRPDTWFEEV